MLPFRDFHLIQFLKVFAHSHAPLDLCLHDYFRSNKALGSKDRAFLAETVYTLVRWQGLLDYFCKPSINWEKRLEVFRTHTLDELQKSSDIPPHVKVSFPPWLFGKLEQQYGITECQEICLTCNNQAPATIRANPLKTTRDQLLQKLQPQWPVSPTKQSDLGIIFHQRLNYFELTEFKEGLFEVQDEGSQLLAQLVQPEPGDQVLDFCAGSGGKTLAFAHHMQGKGQIYLHDIRARALQESRKRLKRAGVQNAQAVHSQDSRLQRLKKKMHWVLVDAPCTGTGTLRRNPDMKWKLQEDDLQRLIGQQRMIFEQALSYLAPNGRIVYGTCSILHEENQAQAEHFCLTYGLEIIEKPLITLPTDQGADGFYGVVLSRK